MNEIADIDSVTLRDKLNDCFDGAGLRLGPIETLFKNVPNNVADASVRA